MKTTERHTIPILLVLLLAVAHLLAPAAVQAHCDGMDGPVVHSAREALAEGDINLVLHWVEADGEHEVRQAFDRATAVRDLNEEVRELADLHFFETLVRIHRMGEGAAYTGLKPAGGDLGPAIPAVDLSLETGELEPVAHLLIEKLKHGLHTRYDQALAKKEQFESGDVEAGRAFVKAYVEYVHYAEGLSQVLDGIEHGHGTESHNPAHLEHGQAQDSDATNSQAQHHHASEQVPPAAG